MTKTLSIFVCWITLAPSGVAQRVQRKPMDVCAALTSQLRGRVMIRGVAEYGRDGFVMGDMTCPVAGSGTEEIPGMILVDVASFETPDVEAAYKSAKEASSSFQVLVEGDLECRLKFSFRANEQGEVVQANGYGSHGLIKCRVRRARLLRIHKLDN